MNRRFVWSFAFVVLASVAVVESLPGPWEDHAAVSATYSRGVLRVTIPAGDLSPGNGTLLMDLLDAQDAVVAHAERHVDAGGAWQQDLQPNKPLPIDDLVWHR